MTADEFRVLLDRYRSGDLAAGDEISRYLSRLFLAIARRHIRNRETAEDVSQEACLAVVDKCRTATFTICPLRWAHGVLRMRIRAYYRKRQRDRRLFEGGSTTEMAPAPCNLEYDNLLESSLITCLRKVFAAKPRYARILCLSYQGYDSDEICAKLKVSKKNLWALLSKARSMLRKCLDSDEVPRV
jgi:RNA polymerase sigma factor (sigma-70 family)